MRQHSEHGHGRQRADHGNLSHQYLCLWQKSWRLQFDDEHHGGRPMKPLQTSLFSRVIQDQDGQVLPWMVFLMVLFLGAAGITVDLGHAYVCYRELQTSTDAAAIAAAYELSQPTATVASVTAAATNYSSVSGAVNVNSNLINPAIAVRL